MALLEFRASPLVSPCSQIVKDNQVHNASLFVQRCLIMQGKRQLLNNACARPDILLHSRYDRVGEMEEDISWTSRCYGISVISWFYSITDTRYIRGSYQTKIYLDLILFRGLKFLFREDSIPLALTLPILAISIAFSSSLRFVRWDFRDHSIPGILGYFVGSIPACWTSFHFLLREAFVMEIIFESVGRKEENRFMHLWHCLNGITYLGSASAVHRGLLSKNIWVWQFLHFVCTSSGRPAISSAGQHSKYSSHGAERWHWRPRAVAILNACLGSTGTRCANLPLESRRHDGRPQPFKRYQMTYFFGSSLA